MSTIAAGASLSAAGELVPRKAAASRRKVRQSKPGVLHLCPFRHNMMVTGSLVIKPVVWMGTSRADLASFPEDVKDAVGYALYIAQRGGKHPDAKPLRGFSGAGILEIVEDHAGDTYRAVYTVRLAERVYVLHAFQKKSKAGIRTPKREIELIRSRLKRAEMEHAKWLEARKEKRA